MVIGLTGPIGCGKSTIGDWLADEGAYVIDADEVARDVTDDWPGVAALIAERFGRSIARPDGSIDRAALGRVVFSDPRALADLEAIIHPAVRQSIGNALTMNEEDGIELTVIEAIKLVEGGLASRCDEVWLVSCDAESQRDRLLGRDLPLTDVDQRITAQAGIVERLRPAATRVIDTSGPIEATRRSVLKALEDAMTRPHLTTEG